MVGKKDSQVEPPSSLQIAQEFVAEYFENYFARRDLKQIKKMLAPDCTGIG